MTANRGTADTCVLLSVCNSDEPRARCQVVLRKWLCIRNCMIHGVNHSQFEKRRELSEDAGWQRRNAILSNVPEQVTCTRWNLQHIHIEWCLSDFIAEWYELWNNGLDVYIYTLNDAKVISSENDTSCETMVLTFAYSTTHNRGLCRVIQVKGVPSLGREGNTFGTLWQSCSDLCDML